MENFGQQLKYWRGNRRLSQLDLALDAEVSARHISFLETGRATPSRPMILHLSEILDVPLERRNDLLEAAGFASLYQRNALTGPHLSQMHDAMKELITRHDPYPAIVKDRLWRIVDLNPTAQTLFGLVGMGQGSSLLDFIRQPGAASAAIQNWGEVGHHTMIRLRNESRAAGGIPEIDEVTAILAKDPLVLAHKPEAPLPPILSTIFRAGDLRLPLFSTFVQFGGAEDLSLAELDIELMFPATAEAREILNGLAQTQNLARL